MSSTTDQNPQAKPVVTQWSAIRSLLAIATAAAFEALFTLWAWTVRGKRGYILVPPTIPQLVLLFTAFAGSYLIMKAGLGRLNQPRAALVSRITYVYLFLSSWYGGPIWGWNPGSLTDIYNFGLHPMAVSLARIFLGVTAIGFFITWISELISREADT